ncbi:MAG: hypothetical protein NT077_00995 [Candidatus Taylorbacteria bacterium]|nr:hypothetical protein [Candidatus Taylorbacteria bacterium]
MSKPIYPIKVHCRSCNTLLYEYDKEGPGSLVKCFVDRITADHTKGDFKCPKCETPFCRLSQIGNRPIHKIIGGKVYIKGHCPK